MEVEIETKSPLLVPKLPQWWRALPTLVLIITIGNIDSLILNDFIEYRYANYYQINSTSSQSSREICLNHSRTTTPPSPPSISTTPLTDHHDRIVPAT